MAGAFRKIFCGKRGKICWQQTLGGQVFAIISNKSSLAGTTVTSVCISNVPGYGIRFVFVHVSPYRFSIPLGGKKYNTERCRIPRLVIVLCRDTRNMSDCRLYHRGLSDIMIMACSMITRMDADEEF